MGDFLLVAMLARHSAATFRLSRTTHHASHTSTRTLWAILDAIDQGVYNQALQHANALLKKDKTILTAKVSEFLRNKTHTPSCTRGTIVFSCDKSISVG